MKKITFLSSFWLKILAILFMTLDHVGIFLQMQYLPKISTLEVANVFRIFGRLSLPLFIFLIVEGVLHTKNIRRYILRLGIIASAISIIFILFEYTNLFPNAAPIYRHGNIFIDLILTALAVYFIKHKDNRIKLLTLLPVAYSVLSFIVKGVETSSNIDILWFPYFMTMQYDWVSVVLGLGFYASYILGDMFLDYLESTSGISKDIWKENGGYRLIVNMIALLINAVVITLQFSFMYMWPEGVFWDTGIQFYAVISGAFILLYSGKRGYNAKWFQYGAYLYYPIHILIIAMIYIIQNGGL